VNRASEVWRRRAAWLTVALLFFGANAGFFLWYRATGQTRQDALEARRTALAGEATAAEREAERLEAQRDRLSRVSAAIEEFYGRRIGTRRATLASLVEQIHSTLKVAGIAPAEIGYSIKPVTGLPLSEMDATFGFAADYQKLKRLLNAFETGPRWIVVRDIALARDAEMPGSVQVRMLIATYFTDEQGERPGRASEAGTISAPPRSRS
jgi:cell division protein FtsB